MDDAPLYWDIGGETGKRKKGAKKAGSVWYTGFSRIRSRFRLNTPEMLSEKLRVVFKWQ